MARPATARAPMPEPTLLPAPVICCGPVAEGEAGVLVAAPAGAVVVPFAPGADGVGGEAGTTVGVTIGIVLVPLVAV